MAAANRRFTILANNSPTQHKIGFYIKPYHAQYFDAKSFIESINFTSLLKDVEYWQSAKFVFDVTGVGKQYNNFIEHEIDVISNVYLGAQKLPEYLLQEINNWDKFFYVKDLTIC